MKGSNTLYAEDIEEFEKALSYETKLMPLLNEIQVHLPEVYA
jgi:hypothetical protein